MLFFDVDPVNIHWDYFLVIFSYNFKVSQFQVLYVAVPINWCSITSIQGDGCMSFPKLVCKGHIHIRCRGLGWELFGPDFARPFWKEFDLYFSTFFLHFLVHYLLIIFL